MKYSFIINQIKALKVALIILTVIGLSPATGYSEKSDSLIAKWQEMQYDTAAMPSETF